VSPQGLFVGMTLEELNAEKAIAQDRARYGDRVALSGSGKSSGRNFSLPADRHLQEVNFAIEQLTGGKPARFNFSPVPRCGWGNY